MDLFSDDDTKASGQTNGDQVYPHMRICKLTVFVFQVVEVKLQLFIGQSTVFYKL